MPAYEYQCPDGHFFMKFLSVVNHSPIWVCDCGKVGQQVIGAPLTVKIAADVCYDSPITGQPITSWAQRTEDLKRNDCIPYEEGMKQDHERRIQESDTSLEKSIEQHVERSIEKMSTKQRGKLYSELTEQGTSLEFARH